MWPKGEMLMERTRLVSGVSAGALWVTTAMAAVANIGIRFYLLAWLATGVASLWALVEVWMARPDHGKLAIVRSRIAEARLTGALMEEADRHATEDRQLRHYLGRVV